MGLSFPAELRYADSHEYAGPSDEGIKVGISAFAVDQLGDIVFVELPEVGASIEKGSSFGTVESVKAVEEMYAPVSGTVVPPRCRSCLLYTSPSPRDRTRSRMPSSA